MLMSPACSSVAGAARVDETAKKWSHNKYWQHLRADASRKKLRLIPRLNLRLLDLTKALAVS